MKYENKKRLLKYLENGGSEEERQRLIDLMKKDEMGYVDLDGMALCNDDEGCANLTHDQLKIVAEELEDRLMDNFSGQLFDVLADLGYK